MTTTYYMPGDEIDLIDIITNHEAHVACVSAADGLAEIDAIIAANNAAPVVADTSVACPRCGGSGDVGRVTALGHSDCLRCYGTGRLAHKGINIGAALRDAETQTDF